MIIAESLHLIDMRSDCKGTTQIHLCAFYGTKLAGGNGGFVDKGVVVGMNLDVMITNGSTPC